MPTIIPGDQRTHSKTTEQSAPVDDPISQIWLDRHYGPETRPPFDSIKLHLEPGAATAPHNHHDTEMWLVLSGQGEVMKNGLWSPVGAGAIVQFDPLDLHSIRNTSDRHALTMVAIWWQCMARLKRAHQVVAGHQKTAPSGLETRPVPVRETGGALAISVTVGTNILACAGRLLAGNDIASSYSTQVPVPDVTAMRDIFSRLYARGLIVAGDGDRQGCCYLRIGALREELTNLFAQSAQQRVMSSALRGILAAVLASDMPDVPITHCADTGVAVARPGFEQQCLDSAFEYAAQCVSAAQDTRSVLVFEIEHAYRMVVLVPALLFGCDYSPPLAWLASHPYRDQGLALRETCHEDMGDTTRLYLALNYPEVAAVHVHPAEVKQFALGILIGQWQAWMLGVAQRLLSFFDAAVPEAGPWSVEAHSFYGDIVALHETGLRVYAVAAFSPRRAVRGLLSLVESALDFAHATASLLEVRSRTREPETHMALELMALRSVALFMVPVAPRFATALLAALGEADAHWDAVPCFLTPGRRVDGLAQLRFEKPALG